MRIATLIVGLIVTAVLAALAAAVELTSEPRAERSAAGPVAAGSALSPAQRARGPPGPIATRSADGGTPA
ncbi:MAG TPA: hypothetical protein VHA57_01785 [Actinomycetota bacterium]|nr:hypothetical protein [Actinomycetota bacterium]